MNQTLIQAEAADQPLTLSLTQCTQWQWLRYGVAGASSAVVDLAAFYVLSTFVYCCGLETLADDVRAHRFVVDKALAFVIANGFSYWLNARYVFTPGRHRRWIELALFFGISSFSCLLGMQLGKSLILLYGVPPQWAAVACIGFSTILNFAFRKLLVFKG